MNTDHPKDHIKIMRDGRAFVNHAKEDEEKDLEELRNTHILFHLDEPICLEEGFTLRDYFRFTSNYKAFWLIDYFLGEYVEEFKNCPNKGCVSEELDYLSLKRVCTHEEGGTIKTPIGLGLDDDERDTIHIDPNINYSIEFHGINEKEDTSYAIEFSELNELLDHEIKFENALISIELPGNYEDYENIEDKFIKREANDFGFTLYEFVKNIIWELSFCGTPKQRREQKDILESRMEEVERERKEWKEKGE